jgi:hypothetical protein
MQSLAEDMDEVAASAEGPLGTMSLDGGVVVPVLDWQVPINPHVELRQDLRLYNDLLLCGADITSASATIFGHGLVLFGISSLEFPPPAGEIAAVADLTGAYFFLGIANVIDAAATADVALTEGPLSSDGLKQEGFFLLNWGSGRLYWYAEAATSLSSSGIQLTDDIDTLLEYGKPMGPEE